MNNQNDDLKELEAFLVNNQNLERLEQLIGEFNIFEALGAVHQEVRHSNFLAFLLNPHENHGMGDRFLKRFLKTALYNQISPEVNVIDIEVGDFTKALVRREWEGIDILIEDSFNKLIVVIENKIKGSEHSRQLQRYRKLVEQTFPGFKKIYIFLTPEGAQPSDENYIALDYEKIAQSLGSLLETSRSIMGEDVATLMGHYITMLRRHIVTDSKIIELCRQIYMQHQHALDLIFEYRPDLQLNLSEFLQKLIRDTASMHGLVEDQSSKSNIRFGLKEWDNVPELKLAKGWTKTGRMVLFEFGNFKDSLGLWLLVGPGPQTLREIVHSYAMQNPDIFRNANKKVHTKWSQIFKRPVLKRADYESLDEQELKQKISKFWKNFLETDLPAIRTSLKKLLDSGALQNEFRQKDG